MASQIPEHIRAAIKCLLEPYEVEFELVKRSSKTEKRYLDVKGAVAYTSLSRWTLSRATADGKLPHIKIGDGKTGKILYDMKDLDGYLMSCKNKIYRKDHKER